MKAWRNSDLAARLGIARPVVQGPFGGGLSSVELVVAVGEAGGLGSFGAHHLEGDGIRSVAADIRRRSDRPFALNLWLPHAEEGESPVAAVEASDHDRHARELAPWYAQLGLEAPPPPPRYLPDFDAQVEAVLAARPAVFSFVFGVPAAGLLDRCRALGILTLGTATTVAEARALDDAGVDAIVASGFEAGGHRVSFLRRPEDCLTGGLALLPQVVDAVRAPVVAAGGIADGRGIVAALSLGASAVQIGTAFLACRQSNASELHRERLFDTAADDTVLTRAFTGRLARGIRNDLATAVPPGGHAPYPLQGWLTGALRAAALREGRGDLVPLWCGQAAGLLRDRDGAALMARLASEVDALLARMA
ncbi:MAG: nitronate monooxygenase [Pseudoxanthomonas sp.]|nr:nitronate monooxygenase [Pseudoxanthomonas sp.]